MARPTVSASGVVKSAARVLEMLELWADAQMPLTVEQVARGLGYPQSSAWTLVHSLQRLGYLGVDRTTRAYLPTLRVALLGTWIRLGDRVGDEIVRGLEEIQRETGETVILALESGVSVQYIHIVMSEALIRLHLQPGMKRPIARAAAGKVLLARKTNAEIGRIVRRLNSQAADRSQLLDESRVIREIEKVRRSGFAETAGTVTDGAGVIAFALPKRPGQPPLAVGVGGPLERLTGKRDRILRILRDWRDGLTSPRPARRTSLTDAGR
jgi:DNA-binding IclR family transcriptional regulator